MRRPTLSFELDTEVLSLDFMIWTDKEDLRSALREGEPTREIQPKRDALIDPLSAAFVSLDNLTILNDAHGLDAEGYSLRRATRFGLSYSSKSTTRLSLLASRTKGMIALCSGCSW
jgi:hypothetical protein